MICNCKEAKIVITCYSHCYIYSGWDDACRVKMKSDRSCNSPLLVTNKTVFHKEETG
jgi:hypothetical protein